MDVQELVHSYPILYHMAALGSWDSVLRHGLLSTRALLDLFEVRGADRERLEFHHRPESETISHPAYGTAVVRDQKPMSDAGLLRALRDGLTPRDWYGMLNSRVFFWVSEERLHVLRNARPYRGDPQTILRINTRRLVEAYAHRIELSPINSGCTKPFASPRGKDCFVRIADFPFRERRRTRGLRQAIVELTVDYAVENVNQFVDRVEIMGPNGPVTVLWP